MHQVRLPELGEDINTAVVACWHYRTGDAVKPDDDLVELVTDKASFHVTADVNGTLKEKKFENGQEVKIGEILAVIDPQTN